MTKMMIRWIKEMRFLSFFFLSFLVFLLLIPSSICFQSQAFPKHIILDHSLSRFRNIQLQIFPSFLFPSIYFQDFPNLRWMERTEQVSPTLPPLVSIRQLTNRKELDEACELCVDAFFGDDSSLWHGIKLRQISSELKELLFKRFDNPDQYTDVYFVAESDQVDDNHHSIYRNKRFQFDRKENRKVNPSKSCIGFALISIVPLDDKLFSYIYSSHGFNRQLDGKFYLPKISNLSVHKSCRGQGIGSRLLEACCQKAIEMGYDQIFLEVEIDNEAALQMYMKAGFVSLYTQNINVYDTKSLFLRNKSKRSLVMRKLLSPGIDSINTTRTNIST